MADPPIFKQATLGSHAACGGRGSARVLRVVAVVVVARHAHRARSGVGAAGASQQVKYSVPPPQHDEIISNKYVL